MIQLVDSLKKKKGKKDQKMYVLTRGKEDALIRQDFNYPAIKRIVQLSV